MKRKLVSFLLTAGMVVGMLSGCGSKPTGEAAADGAAVESGDAEAAQDSEDVKDDGEPYTVAIQLVNLTSDQTDVEMVEEAINEITVPAINCKVDIQNTLIGELANKTSMNVVSGDKMDIVCVGLTQKISDISDDGILMPLDDYLQYAPTYVDLVKDYMEVGNVDGVQYALPTDPYLAVGKGFVYNKDMAEQYGIELKDGATFEDLTKAFEAVSKDGIFGTSNGAGTSLNTQFYYNIEVFGANGEYGMIADPVNSTKVESLYGSDYFKEYCELMKSWMDAGYMPEDALTNTTSPQEYLAMGKLLGCTTNYDMSQFAIWQSGQSFNIDMVQIQDPIVTTSAVAERMWGLSTTCQNPQKAMEFLNYMYENPQVANLLQYGIEGQNYVMVEGTERTITTEGSATGNNGYISIFTHFGNPVDILAAVPNTDSYPDDVKAYNEGVESSATLGYSFNVSEFSAEAGAVANVIAEYLPRLQAGQVGDVDSYLEDFLKALDDAGYNAIIAANQEQLDAFLAQKK